MMSMIKDLLRPLFQDELDKLEAAITVQSKTINTLSRELLEAQTALSDMKLKKNSILQFTSKYEFRNWLIANPIDQNEYVKDVYDCEDFAIATSFAALEDGKWIFPIFDTTGYFTPLKMHVLVGTVVNNTLLVAEPQTDSIVYEGRLDP